MKNIDSIEPSFFLSDDNLLMIKKIERKLSKLRISDGDKKIKLKKRSHAKSIYSSLAIESNSLSLDNIYDIMNDKITPGKKNEVQEVKNINELYKHINDYNFLDENDFIKAHQIMMKYLDDNDYRNHGEGVSKDKELVFFAPDSLLVPSLMKSLFKYLDDNKDILHPFILAAVFHYYLVYIHPFRDGNGRMARFWTCLILVNYNYKFEYLPIDEMILLNREEYYDAISKCHMNENVNVFIDFMLKVIYQTLNKMVKRNFFERLVKP